jgi:REP element-mobilizing transposase RayT
MGRTRASAQLELPKLDKNGQRRGGKRRGAGRKPNGKRRREKHCKRPALKDYNPIHITLRVVASASGLRRRHVYHAVRRAMSTTYRTQQVRIVHISLQGDHLHLLVEANDRQALSRGLQGFESLAARLINEAISKRTGCLRTGKVFADRYHEEVIDSPRQARNAIKYVLSNWRKHGEDRGRTCMVDPYSSATRFDGWTEVATAPFRVPKEYRELPTAPPRSWLLRKGWKKAGPISVWDVPGPSIEGQAR